VTLRSRALERRGLTPSSWSITDPSAIPPNSQAGLMALAGVPVNERSALQCGTVMSCVRVLGEDLSSLPVYGYQQVGAYRQPLQAWTATARFLADPFVEMRPTTGWFRLVASRALRGNSYCYITARDELGYPLPQSLLPLHPDKVNLRRENGRRVWRVNGVVVDEADIWHVPWFTLPGVDLGLSPIEYFAQGIGVAIATEAFGAQYFGQGTVMSGVLTSEQALADDKVRAIYRRLIKRHGGIRHAHLPLVLEAGLKWQPLTVNPNEAQFLETRGFNRETIAGFYGVPARRIGASAKAGMGGGKGADSDQNHYVINTLRHWAIGFEDHLVPLLRGEDKARFNLDAMLRADPETRWRIHQTKRAIAAATVNEIRADEDMAPDGDERAGDLFAPLNSAQSGDGTTTADGQPGDPADHQDQED
jgi:HK97 family phage portal protein